MANQEVGAATILIVEDDLALQSMLVDMLQNEGYQTIGTTTGSAALGQLNERTPDLVLLDLWLPDMDGYAVCQALRQRVGPRVPIVMLTAHRDSRSALEGFNAGANDYLRKPFAVEALLAQIRAHLTNAAQARLAAIA